MEDPFERAPIFEGTRVSRPCPTKPASSASSRGARSRPRAHDAQTSSCASFETTTSNAALACIAEIGLEFGPTTAIDDETFVMGRHHGMRSALWRRGRARRSSHRASPRSVIDVASRSPKVRALRVRRFMRHRTRPRSSSPMGARRSVVDTLRSERSRSATISNAGSFGSTSHDRRSPPHTEKFCSFIGSAIARARFEALDGEDRVLPRPPYEPPIAIEERYDLDDGATSIEALIFVAKRLVDRLASRLVGRSATVSMLEVSLELDCSFVDDGQSPKLDLSLEFATPHANATDLLRFVKGRLEAHFESASIFAPVRAVVLRAPVVVKNAALQRDLLERHTKADDALHRIVAELEIAIGRENVGVLGLCDRWDPAARSVVAPEGIVVSSSSAILNTTGQCLCRLNICR